MHIPSPDSTERFSNRVANYVRYRPSYPLAILDLLRQKTGLKPTDAIADIGSGTGISADFFLKHGYPVFGIEPNDLMRQAAETALNHYDDFHSLDGTAENTLLPSQSVDYVLAAQAFHWFDRDRAKGEFARILRPKGWIVLIWNRRRLDSTPFLQAYETLLKTYGTDYQSIRHETLDQSILDKFFAPNRVDKHSFPNYQTFDWEGIRGRLESSSYTPSPDHPSYTPMIQDLKKIFHDHAENDAVLFEYDTEVFLGQLSPL